MTKEEKDAIIAKGEEEAKAKANAEEPKIESEDEIEEEPADEKIDYEAIAAAEAERAEKAEKALADRDYKEREARRKAKDEEGDDKDEDEDKPLTRREARALLDAQRQESQKDSQETRALEIARANTSSEAEAKAAVTYWKNRVLPTGDLTEDVLFAIGGLNRKKVIAQNSELAKALKSKENVSKDSAGTYRTDSPGGEVKMSSADAGAIKAAGMVWDGVKRAYKKPLGNGKTFLYYDPKSKRRWKQ